MRKQLQNLSMQQIKYQGYRFFVVSGLLERKEKGFLKQREDVQILDISNLLYSVEGNDELTNKLIAFLPYSVMDIVPQKCFVKSDSLQQGAYMMAFRVNEDIIYNKYLLAVLRNPRIQAQIAATTVGDVIPHFKKQQLGEIRIPIPPMKIQKRIGDLYFMFCAKEECNKKINNNLLEQIKTICSAWLSDYKPFDGVMPSDWVETPLSDVAEFISGYSYKGTELTDSTIAMATIKNFDRKGGFKLDGYKEIIPSSKLKESQHAELFDTLVAHTDLTQNAEVIGNAEPVMSKSGYDDIVFSMDLVKVLPKKDSVSKFLIAAILQDKKFKAHCLGYVNGTTVLHLSKKALPEYKLFLPSDFSTLKPLDEVVTALYKQVSSNIFENTYLEELRDTLLPKLMSGELDVSDIEI